VARTWALSTVADVEQDAHDGIDAGTSCDDDELDDRATPPDERAPSNHSVVAARTHSRPLPRAARDWVLLLLRASGGCPRPTR